MYIAATVQQRLDIALFPGLDLDAFQKLAHPVVGTEVGVDEHPGLFRRHAGVSGKAEVTETVEQAEVDDLGEPALIRGHLGLGNAENFRGRAGVDVLAAREGVEQDGVIGHVRQDAKFDL